MLAVAGSRSLAYRITSVRPPLSSVMARSTSTLTASFAPPWRPPGWRGCGRFHPPPPRLPGERERKRQPHRRLSRPGARARPAVVAARPRAIDADRVDEHFRLADQGLQRVGLRAAVGVVAVGDHHHRLLLVPAALRHRHRLGDGVVQRRAAPWPQPPERIGDLLAVRGPVAHHVGAIGEAEEEDLVLGLQQVVEEAIERRLRGTELLARHAAADVEHDAEAHGHALAAEVRDLLSLAVFAHEEVLLAQAGRESTRTVGHRRGDVDQLGRAAKPEAVLLRSQRPHGERRDQDGQQGGAKAGDDACVHGSHQVTTKPEEATGATVRVRHEAAVRRPERDAVAAHVGMRGQFDGEGRFLPGTQLRGTQRRAAAAQHAARGVEQHHARHDVDAVRSGDRIADDAAHDERALVLLVRQATTVRAACRRSPVRWLAPRECAAAVAGAGVPAGEPRVGHREERREQCAEHDDGEPAASLRFGSLAEKSCRPRRRRIEAAEVVGGDRCRRSASRPRWHEPSGPLAAFIQSARSLTKSRPDVGSSSRNTSSGTAGAAIARTDTGAGDWSRQRRPGGTRGHEAHVPGARRRIPAPRCRLRRWPRSAGPRARRRGAARPGAGGRRTSRGWRPSRERRW